MCACGAPQVEAPAAADAVPENHDLKPLESNDEASSAGQFLKASLLGEMPRDSRLESADPEQGRDFIDDLIAELESLYAMDLSDGDPDRLAKALGVEPVDSPFRSTLDKFWGAGLIAVVEAVQPTMRRAIWSEADFALVQRFADYAEMGPLDPLLELTGTNRRHDLEELERFVGWLSERFEDCQFRGGLALSLTGGPYRPQFLDEPRLPQPTSQIEVTGWLRLATGLSSAEDPQSVIQAVDSLDAVAWTCALPGAGDLSFAGPPERLEKLGWNIPLQAGGERTSVFLDDTGRPCYYFVPF